MPREPLPFASRCPLLGKGLAAHDVRLLLPFGPSPTLPVSRTSKGGASNEEPAGFALGDGDRWTDPHRYPLLRRQVSDRGLSHGNASGNLSLDPHLGWCYVGWFALLLQLRSSGGIKGRASRQYRGRNHQARGPARTALLPL